MEKGKNRGSIFKVKQPPKTKGDYFEKLGFDYRAQIWYEGDMIDTFEDVEQKIDKWSQPFEELTSDLNKIIQQQTKQYSSQVAKSMALSNSPKKAKTPKPEPISEYMYDKVTK